MSVYLSLSFYLSLTAAMCSTGDDDKHDVSEGTKAVSKEQGKEEMRRDNSHLRGMIM